MLAGPGAAGGSGSLGPGGWDYWGPGPQRYMLGDRGQEGNRHGGGQFEDVSSFEGGCGKSAGDAEGNRISGGGKAKKHAFPWVVRILM